MKCTLWALTIMAAGVLLVPGLAIGHHGYAAFDTRAEITFAGTVTGFNWTNPHCVVEFDAMDNTGKVRAWRAEMSSPAHLAPRGWTAATLEPGDKITITGYPGKNNVASFWVTKIILPDGKSPKTRFEQEK